MTTQELRVNLQRLIHKKNISWDIWKPIYHHIALIETEPGDVIAKEILSMLENGATEEEISQVAQEKYKIEMK